MPTRRTLVRPDGRAERETAELLLETEQGDVRGILILAEEEPLMTEQKMNTVSQYVHKDQPASDHGRIILSVPI